MAITTTISQKELKRIAGLCYEGKYARISLASLGSQGFTTESTVVNWDTIKISGNGYSDVLGLINTGSYDTGDARYEMPEITATFTAMGTGFTYNTIYVVLGTASSAGITNVSLTGNVATITTDSAHGFDTGKTVVINGLSTTVLNGTYIITGTPTVTSFTYAKNNADIGSTSDLGVAVEVTEEQFLHSIISESPPVLLSPDQSVTYKIQFCTDD